MAASDLQARVRALAEAELARLEQDSRETSASGTIKSLDLSRLAALVRDLDADGGGAAVAGGADCSALSPDELRVLISLMNKARGRPVDLRPSVSPEGARAIAFAAVVPTEAVQPLPVPRSLDQDEIDALVAEYQGGNHSIARLAASYGVSAGAVMAFLRGAGLAVKGRP